MHISKINNTYKQIKYKSFMDSYMSHMIESYRRCLQHCAKRDVKVTPELKQDFFYASRCLLNEITGVFPPKLKLRKQILEDLERATAKMNDWEGLKPHFDRRYK